MEGGRGYYSREEGVIIGVREEGVVIGRKEGGVNCAQVGRKAKALLKSAQFLVECVIMFSSINKYFYICLHFCTREHM